MIYDDLLRTISTLTHSLNMDDLVDKATALITLAYIYKTRNTGINKEVLDKLNRDNKDLKDDNAKLKKQNKLIEDQYDSLMVRYQKLEGRYLQMTGEEYRVHNQSVLEATNAEIN